MSKKHYQEIAREMHRIRGLAGDDGELHMWRACVSGLADVFAAGNRRFDRDRFREACETGRCKGMRAQ